MLEIGRDFGSDAVGIHISLAATQRGHWRAMEKLPGLFLTGAMRSGTSLLDKLLTSHSQMTVLSQPLPRLYVELKRAFNQVRRASDEPASEISQAFPLSDLFWENYANPTPFTDFLAAHRLEPSWLANVLGAMAAFDGQYFKSTIQIETLLPRYPVSLARFVTDYLETVSRSKGHSYLGSKETFAEEYIPYFLRLGTKVIMCVRDPRDVLASVLTGRGPELAGAGLPLLFVLRQWRKSVAYALEYERNQNLRVIRYEDLVGNPRAALAGIATWLGCLPFAENVAGVDLRDASGGIWLSNSSHRSARGISKASVGIHRSALSDTVNRAIEILCGPEMGAFAYGDEPGVAPVERRKALEALDEICPDPRPSLRGYTWRRDQIDLELLRLETLDQGHYDARLHIFPGAFERLSRAPGGAGFGRSSWRTVHEMRASTIIYNLARKARPGLFLLPANICAQVPLAIATAGRRFQLIDIDPKTLCMCPRAALDIIGARAADIAGVIYARTYGACFDAASFFARVKELDRSILLVDDKCSCRPDIEAVIDSNVDATIYSTTYAKYIDLGWGGFGLLRESHPYERHDLAFDATQAAELSEHFSRIANAHFSNIQSGPAIEEVLRRWPGWLDTRVPEISWRNYSAALKEGLPSADRHKGRLNDIYRRNIPESAWLGDNFNAWRFNIRVPAKAELLEKLFASGLFASGHFRPATQLFGGAPAPHCEQLYGSVVNLFNDRNASEAHATKVTAIVTRHITSYEARIKASSEK